MDIKYNIQVLRQQLTASVSLIAVSKTQPTEVILRAYDAGQRVFGENKAQELCAKYEVLPKDIEWHMIGHLQTNKVKYIAPFVALIHGVDSLKLLTEINKQGQKVKRVIRCLLQVHIAREETKFGFSEEEVVALLQSTAVEPLQYISIAGLMGMASLTENQEQVRKEFRQLKSLYERLAGMALPANVTLRELSMGMSSDYRIALEEGSTMVRIGTAIFGERHTP
jgi:hypothetical protein